MRKKIVVGNWKMNTNLEEAYNLVIDINKHISKEKECIILVPFTHIKTLQELAYPHVKVGAQNVSQFENGAYTGEISASILHSLDVKFVTIGHSERRIIFNENNDTIQTKIDLALQNKLKPIICCGEPIEVRQENKYLEFIEKQIQSALQNITPEKIVHVMIAYEPIWAIGTGETASASQAQEVHAFIRNIVENKFGSIIANDITILYGGSVKPFNAEELFSKKDIDGALVGGASLMADSFIDIINANK